MTESSASGRARARALAGIAGLVATASLVAVAPAGAQPLAGPPAPVAPATGGVAGGALARADAAGRVDAGAARGARAVAVARRQLGTPYRYGGQDPSGFDCSGLVRYAYGEAGLEVPRVTTEQFAAYPRVARRDLRPGDLVFFDGLGHDGIYLGDGRFIHAPSSGDVVRVSRIDADWYGERYEGAVRPG